MEELNLLPWNYFQEGEFSAAWDKTSREKGSSKNSSPKVKKKTKFYLCSQNDQDDERVRRRSDGIGRSSADQIPDDVKISEQTGRMRLKWFPWREDCQNSKFWIHWVDDPRNSSLPKYKRYVRLLEEITKENMVMVNLRTHILSAGFLLCWPKFLIITNTSIIHVFPNCHIV